MKHSHFVWIGLLAAFLVLALSGRNLSIFHATHLITSGDASELRESHVVGVLLETPADFQGIEVDFGSTGEAIQNAEGYKCVIRGLEIQVIRIVYKEGVELSLEGSVQGSIEGLAHAPGMRNLTHRQVNCTVSGKPAMHVSVTADRGGTGIGLEGVTILDKQTLYQIQALFEASYPRSAEYAKRIIDSVKLEPQ